MYRCPVLKKLLDKLHQEDHVLTFGEGFYAADPKVLYTVHPKLLLMKLDLLFLHVTPDVATSVSEHLINEKVDNSLYYAASYNLGETRVKGENVEKHLMQIAEFEFKDCSLFKQATAHTIEKNAKQLTITNRTKQILARLLVENSVK